VKVLILTPTRLPDLTGNAMTAERLRFGLEKEGIKVEVIRSDSPHLPSKLTAFKPDIIHALHAKKSGLTAMDCSRLQKIPFLVTITGTDLYRDLLDSNRNDTSLVLEATGAVVVYSNLTLDRLKSELPNIPAKTRVINKAVHFNETSTKDISSPKKAAFLLPSGIRPVKAPSFAIEPLEKLKKEFPHISLTVAGPRLDDGEWELFSRKSKGKDWIRHFTVSHDEMPDIYREADIVLNTSISEGLSNAVLEAMYFGRPVLASNCEGNMAAIENGKEGLLYKNGDEEDFINKARLLLRDPAVRLKLGRNGKEKILHEHSLDGEINAHISLYKELLKAGKKP